MSDSSKPPSLPGFEAYLDDMAAKQGKKKAAKRPPQKRGAGGLTSIAAFRASSNGSGIESSEVPFAALTESFSSIARSAPPPFGRSIEGTRSLRVGAMVEVSTGVHSAAML